jgi:hypothetical protein
MTSPTKVLLTATLVILLTAAPSLGQTDEDWDWVNNHFASIFNQLMPIERDDLINIGFRTHRDLHTEVLEYSFLLTLDYPANTITGVERVANGISIYDQLMKLHRQNPNESADNLKKQIRINEKHFTQTKCPAIRALFFQFDKIRFHGPSIDLVLLHPLYYEIKSDVGAGNMHLVFVEPNQPLVKWSMRVKSALKVCASRKNQ